MEQKMGIIVGIMNVRWDQIITGESGGMWRGREVGGGRGKRKVP